MIQDLNGEELREVANHLDQLRRGEIDDTCVDDRVHATYCCVAAERYSRIEHLAERLANEQSIKLANLLSSEVGEKLAIAVQEAIDKLDYS